MAVKIYNPITGKWEVQGASLASEIGITDISGNFNSNNVEGCLGELAEASQTQENDLNGTKKNLESIKEDFYYHIANHPGGSGGGGGGSMPTITSDFEGGSVDADTELHIPIFYSSPNLGEGICYVMLEGIEVGVYTVKQGNNLIRIGKLPQLTNKISMYVKDRAGMMSNQLSWTVIRGGVDLTVDFDFDVDYSIDDVIRMPFTVTSASNDPIILHLTVDSAKKEIPCVNGYNEYIFEGLGVGIHKVEIYATSGKYKSKVINSNIVIVNSYALYVSTTFEGGAYEYGVPITIPYRVSKLSSETFTINLYLDGIINKTLKAPSGSYYWTLSLVDTGDHDIKIEALSDQGEKSSVEKSFSVYYGDYTPVKPVTNGLIAWYDATGKTNQDENKDRWEDKAGNSNPAILHNFNYAMNGWIDDKLVCDNEAYVEIDLKPYKDNVRLGSTIDILYTPRNIGFEDARVLDYTDVEVPYKGISINLLEATLRSLVNVGVVAIDEEEQVRVTFVIDRTNLFGKLYVNAILCRAFYLSDTGSGVDKFYEDFSHNQKIYLNSEKGIKNFGACDIEHVRVYGRALSSDEILQNHMADIKDIEKQKEKYKFNYENVTTPTIRMYGDDSNMTESIPADMRIKYTSPNEELYGSSFDLPYCSVTWQGTSSLQYVLKNYTIRLKDENMAEYLYTPYRNGVLESIYCLKAD